MRAEPANLCLLLSVGKGRSRIAARWRSRAG